MIEQQNSEKSANFMIYGEENVAAGSNSQNFITFSQNNSNLNFIQPNQYPSFN